MESADLLICGCTVLPMNSEAFIEDGAIAITKGKISFVGKFGSAASIRAERRIDGAGKVAMPGLVNCHTHVAMTLFRGLAEDKPLETWLKETIWPLEAKLKKDDVCAGALLGCLEMIKSGTTCFGDMYFHEGAVAKAAAKSGLRAALAEGIIEAGNRLVGEMMLRRSLRFAKRFRDYAEGRVTTMLGPHAVYTCSRGLLQKISRKAQELKVGLHLHLAESGKMFEGRGETGGSSEVEFLDKIGFLNGHVLAAHCIDLSEGDMLILSRRGVNVAYCPVANMKLGLRAAKIKDLTRLNVNVGLGTDGPASNNSLDMFETMKTGAILQKSAYSDSSVLRAYEALKMATVNGATALRIGESVGSLEVGKKADIILIDFSKPYLTPRHNVYANIVYSAQGADVDTVIVDGKILMENRHVKTLDEEAVMEKAQKAAEDLLSR